MVNKKGELEAETPILRKKIKSKYSRKSVNPAEYIAQIKKYVDKIKESKGDNGLALELRTTNFSAEVDENKFSVNFAVEKLSHNDFSDMLLHFTKAYSSKWDDILEIKSGGQGVTLTRKHETSSGYSILKPKHNERSVEIKLPAYEGLHKLGEYGNVNITYKGLIHKNDSSILIGLLEKLNGSFENQTIENRVAELGAELLKPAGLSWDILGGYEDIKADIRKTVILPTKHSDVYESIVDETRQFKKNIDPRAVLFSGPPGTGKTTAGKIIASEIEMPFINVPVEQIFEKWYGESAKNLARIFDIAQIYKPCVLFIDEFDALARARSHRDVKEDRKVLSVLLSRIDGITTEPGVLVIGTTNLADDLDPAIRSRFDENLDFRLPNNIERAEIFKLYAKHLEDGDLKELGKISDGFSGRDIETSAKYAERSLAREIIENGREYFKPPVELYVKAINKYKKNYI